MQFTVEQMTSLSERVRREGNQRIASHLDARFPQVFAGRDAAERDAVVERMRAAAAPFGLERDDHVGVFTDLFVMYGPDFPNQPWAAPVLNSTVLDASAKVRTLVRRVRASGVDF